MGNELPVTMATPTYVPFDPAKPAITQTRQAEIDAARTNALAMRDCFIAMLGLVSGWALGTYSPNGPEKPVGVYPYRGAEWFWVVYTWGTTGGATDNPTQINVSYTNDSLSTTVIMPDLSGKSVATIAHDADGYVNSITWS